MKKLIVGNWKMHPEEITDAKLIASGVKRRGKKISKVDVVLCPPAVYLAKVTEICLDSRILTGAQDVFWKVDGSYTGQISVPMLKSAGAKYVIVGHSERRALGETDSMVSKKVWQVVKAGLVAIVCVGEKERDSHGDYLHFIEKQIKASLAGIDKADVKRIVLAYEPIWAIGKSDREAMPPAQIHETTLFLRKICSDLFPNVPAVKKLPILYGGSVSSEIAEAILRDGEVDGLLVGGKSLDVEDFCQIISIANGL